MDGATIAAGAVAVLAPYFAEAGKKVASKAGEAAWGHCEKLWTLVKGKLVRPEQAAALVELQATPDDLDVQAAARVQIRKALAADEGFAGELAAVLESLPETVKQQMHVEGDGNTAVQASGSTLNITR